MSKIYKFVRDQLYHHDRASHYVSTSFRCLNFSEPALPNRTCAQTSAAIVRCFEWKRNRKTMKSKRMSIFGQWIIRIRFCCVLLPSFLRNVIFGATNERIVNLWVWNSWITAISRMLTAAIDRWYKSFWWRHFTISASLWIDVSRIPECYLVNYCKMNNTFWLLSNHSMTSLGN